MDPISLENIDILADWVDEEPALMTIEEVHDWANVEVGCADGDIPEFDEGNQVNVANEDDDGNNDSHDS